MDEESYGSMGAFKVFRWGSDSLSTSSCDKNDVTVLVAPMQIHFTPVMTKEG